MAREFMALHERGAIKNGLGRGFLAGFFLQNISSFLGNISPQGGFISGMLFQLVTNPISIAQVHKQVVTDKFDPPSYK